MRVGLFVTCLVDLMRPRIGFSAISLLEAGGCEVIVPSGQTCCGQPAHNSGDATAARQLARKTIVEFESFDYVVAPSGSCADQIKTEYPKLFPDEPEWRVRAEKLAARTYELCQFLETKLQLQLQPEPMQNAGNGVVTYHDSCTGYRSLGVFDQPRKLLQRLAGIKITEMAGSHECCGFGGTFSVKFGDVSSAIAERKCQSILAAQADTIVGGDLGCLLNIEGKLRRMGKETVAVRHVADVLADHVKKG